MSTPTETPTIMTPENAPEAMPVEAVMRKFGGVKSYQPQSFNKGVVLSVCGPGGTGKSTFASTAIQSEYGRPMHVLDMNANSDVMPRDPNIFITPIDNTAQIDTILTEYERHFNDDIHFLVFDHFSAMYQQSVQEADEKDGRASYNKAQSWAIRTVRRVLNLAEKPPYLSALFVFQEVTEQRVQEDENGVPQIIARKEVNLSNKMQGYFPSMVPFMGFMRIGLNKPPWPRVFDMRPAWHHQAKFQPKGGMAAFDKVPLEMWQPSMATILDTFVGGKPWPIDKHKRP